MGFMDRAKKMAEQAQEKLDEVQKDFNERQAAPGAASPAGETEGPPVAEPARPAKPPTEMPAPPEGTDDHAPPKMTGGDPLSG